jgi:restriction endonuclease S subunit
VSVRFERLRDLIVEARPGFASGERDTTGVLQLRMGSVTFSGNVNWSKAVRVPAPSDLPRYELINGDVVFNNTNSQELVGRASLVDGVPERATFSNHITRLRCCDRLDPGYLVFWLNSRWVAGFFFKFAHRWVGQSAIQVARLLDLEIPLPPFDEQRRIAARLRDQLREVDALALAATAQDVDLAHLRTRAYETAFPVTPLSVTTESASPRGWTWHLLGSLARLESGHTPSRSRADWWGGDIPWIALPDIRALDGRHVFDTLERTNPEGIAHSAARILPTGTVVLSRTASVGFVTIMGRPMATSQDFVNWVCGPDLDPEFLMHLFIRSRERFRSLSAGAVHQTVYFPTAMALRVCAPPVDEQRRVVGRLREQLAEIDRAKALLEAQRTAIDALPAALLREVFGASPVGG